MSTSTRGRKPKYSSPEERRQARNTRDRARYQRQQHTARVSVFENVFQPPLGLAQDLQNTIQPRGFASTNLHEPQFPEDYDNGFTLLQMNDEFEELLPLPSPSLGSASMDISEVESCELNIQEPIQQVDDSGFQDIDDLVLDIDQLDIEKLAIQLTNQLVQFQGCCRDCHKHSSQEHADEHTIHCSL
jgi:hypothetical protein